MNNYRIISEEDCIIDNDIYSRNDIYKDGVICECGKVIHFKNRKPFETVIVQCTCGKEIIYG